MDKLDTDVLKHLEKLELEPQVRRIQFGRRVGFSAKLHTEPIFSRGGKKSKWRYIPYGSNINPFFPEESVPEKNEITSPPSGIEKHGNDNNCPKSETPAQKPVSIFAKYKSDDHDYDPYFVVYDEELQIPEGNSSDAMLQHYKNQNNLSEKDDLMLKIISDPKLNYLGKMIVRRRLTADRILRFTERDWQRFEVNTHKDRLLILKYLKLSTSHDC